MYETIKFWVFTSLYLLLWSVFLLKSGDPTMLGEAANAEGALPIYAGWRGFIDVLYTVSGWLCFPLQWAIDTLVHLAPAVKTDWFPQLEAAAFAESLEKLVTTSNKNLPLPKAWMDWITAGHLEKVTAGVFTWTPLLMVIILSVISRLLDPLVEAAKNLVWNVLIEFSFTKKKQDKYQQELAQRTEALHKLYSENVHLSKQTDELQTSVITDEMTQVYNKRFFVQKMTEAMEQAKKRGQILSLVMMDIDHFKKFNDTYGHLLGDKVLIKVAEAAKRRTPNHSFCCRYGGEEFGVIMPAKNFEEAKAICDAIRTAVPTIRLDEDPNITVTISQGLVVIDFSKPENQKIHQFLDVVKMADEELYRAKEEGRNRCCFRRLDGVATDAPPAPSPLKPTAPANPMNPANPANPSNPSLF
jgi:diguanylate cyclase (GGDEF)-like protein